LCHVETKQQQHKEGPKGQQFHGFVFEMLDGGGVGCITRQEYNAGFDMLDSDHAGVLVRKDFGYASCAHFDRSVLDVCKDGRLKDRSRPSGIECQAAFSRQGSWVESSARTLLPYSLASEGALASSLSGGAGSSHFNLVQTRPCTLPPRRETGGESGGGASNMREALTPPQLTACHFTPRVMRTPRVMTSPSMSQQAAGCHVKKVDGRVGGLTGGQDTESHIIVRSEFVFEFLDADSDGWITEKEYRAAFDVLDSDHDGRVSRDEFGHASYALFDMLDVDKDGKLSRHEYEAGFPLMDLDCDGRICKRDLNTFAAPRIWRGDAGDKAGDRGSGGRKACGKAYGEEVVVKSSHGTAGRQAAAPSLQQVSKGEDKRSFATYPKAHAGLASTRPCPQYATGPSLIDIASNDVEAAAAACLPLFPTPPTQTCEPSILQISPSPKVLTAEITCSARPPPPPTSKSMSGARGMSPRVVTATAHAANTPKSTVHVEPAATPATPAANPHEANNQAGSSSYKQFR